MIGIIAIAAFIIGVMALFSAYGLMAIPAIAVWCAAGFGNVRAHRYFFGDTPDLYNPDSATVTRIAVFCLGPIASAFYLVIAALVAVMFTVDYLKNGPRLNRF